MFTFLFVCSIVLNFILAALVILFFFVAGAALSKVKKYEAGTPPDDHAHALRDLQGKYRLLGLQFNALQAKWGALVDRINALGGEQFLSTAKMPGALPQAFTPDELRKLVKLCHPDHHHGDATMQSITQKLLAMRK